MQTLVAKVKVDDNIEMCFSSLLAAIANQYNLNVNVYSFHFKAFKVFMPLLGTLFHIIFILI